MLLKFNRIFLEEQYVLQVWEAAIIDNVYHHSQWPPISKSPSKDTFASMPS